DSVHDAIARLDNLSGLGASASSPSQGADGAGEASPSAREPSASLAQAVNRVDRALSKTLRDLAESQRRLDSPDLSAQAGKLLTNTPDSPEDEPQPTCSALQSELVRLGIELANRDEQLEAVREACRQANEAADAAAAGLAKAASDAALMQDEPATARLERAQSLVDAAQVRAEADAQVEDLRQTMQHVIERARSHLQGVTDTAKAEQRELVRAQQQHVAALQKSYSATASVQRNELHVAILAHEKLKKRTAFVAWRSEAHISKWANITGRLAGSRSLAKSQREAFRMLRQHQLQRATARRGLAALERWVKGRTTRLGFAAWRLTAQKLADEEQRGEHEREAKEHRWRAVEAIERVRKRSLKSRVMTSWRVCSNAAASRRSWNEEAKIEQERLMDRAKRADLARAKEAHAAELAAQTERMQAKQQVLLRRYMARMQSGSLASAMAAWREATDARRTARRVMSRFVKRHARQELA
ncbi:unnamed protein product, partial [Symbiodinium microadriaticum]